jgi:hypothetical protein
VNALRKLVTYASFKRPAAVVPGAPLVEPVEIGICRFFAGVAALLVDVADCEAAPPRSLPEENDSQIGRIGPRSIGIHKLNSLLQFFFIEFYKTGPVTSCNTCAVIIRARLCV